MCLQNNILFNKNSDIYELVIVPAACVTAPVAPFTAVVAACVVPEAADVTAPVADPAIPDTAPRSVGKMLVTVPMS